MTPSGNSVRKSLARECFLLLEPKAQGNAQKVATAIANCKGVRKVFLTSGRYGFVVSAKADSRNSIKAISSRIGRASRSGAISVAVSHFSFRR